MSVIAPIQSFTFEGSDIRVFGDAINPLFVASDVCKALGIKNVTQALSSLSSFEKTKILIEMPNPKANDPMLKIGLIKKEVNAVTESGLYTLALRCRDAITEGTPSYRFRLKVTNEILPQIRRTGRYECPLANSATNDAKINETEQYEIQEAIRKRAKNCSVHYQTIYHALYDKFKIPSYKDLRRDQLSAALMFIEVVPLTPQIQAPKPEIPEGFYLVDRNTLLAMHSIVYLMWLNKSDFDHIGCAMQCIGSSITGRFRGFTLETQGPRKVVERALEKFGFDCRLPSREVLSIPL